jgi:hypothetical protein
MTGSRFTHPVAVVVDEGDSAARVAMIDNARDAMKAMNDGLGRFALNRPDWQLTFLALGEAVIDPTPEKLEKAREAFERLVRSSCPAADNAELSQ